MLVTNSFGDIEIPLSLKGQSGASDDRQDKGPGNICDWKGLQCLQNASGNEHLHRSSHILLSIHNQ